ncbi:MAG: hypothetical protein M3Y77_22445 [Actinomycetota bacterium]|nr:hypothetical protein [Actinomycetota bacterium]
MYVAGRESWKISIDEPQVLRIALYLRDIVGLAPRTVPDIPPLDPPPTAWPAWVRRPEEPAPVRLSEVQREAASAQWALWWNEALAGGASALQELAQPSFKSFAQLPDLRALLASYAANAQLWSSATADDPRVKRDHLAPGRRLTQLVSDLERAAGRNSRAFTLRITVIPVQTKHAWVLDRGHLLITHHLIRDDENVLDWLRPQIRALV